MPEINQREADSTLEEVERRKYQKAWSIDQYSVTSPAYHRFFDQIKKFISPGEKIIDFGCGTGLILGELAKSHEVLGVDIADNCLKVDVPFKQACLWNPIGVSGDMGVSVDVMEHIPTSKVDAVMYEIMQCVPKCFFMACMLPDTETTKKTYGVGSPLHLTVRKADWWRAKAKGHGNVTHFSSDTRSAIFVIER